MAKKKTQRFPGYKWFCVVCGECLSDQAGFDDNKYTWKCTRCNYKNSISRDYLKAPYAYLVDDSSKNRIVHFFAGMLSSIYGFLFRTAIYFLIAAITIVATHRTDIDHLSLGLISPRGLEDYFCASLYTSGIIVLILLILYALSKRLVGRPDIKKHFLRQTVYFVRDNLLYPIRLIQSLFKKTTLIDKLLSIIALLILVFTICFLVYGCLNLV